MESNQIIKQARARFDHAAARRILREKYEAKLLFADQGGMWRAGPELLVLLNSCPDDTVVLLDLYDIPIKVTVKDLYQRVYEHWQEQMLAWLIEHDALTRQR